MRISSDSINEIFNLAKKITRLDKIRIEIMEYKVLVFPLNNEFAIEEINISLNWIENEKP